MLKISNNDISLTRGDTARLTVPTYIVIGEEKQPYTVKEDDVMKLTVKKEYRDEPMIEKKITGSNSFHIKPEDTKPYDFGTYKYDVELTTVDGDNYTIVEDKKFKITYEVG
jgi:hypothetical protein